MSLFEYFIIGVALSMDAFAVAICKGLSIKKLNLKAPVTIGLYFGIFQALMPLIGYYLGSIFSSYIIAFDHWISFVLLALIGANMIKESFESECECEADDSLSVKTMLLLAVATSIDALAVGVTFSFQPDARIFSAITIIGCTTFVLSMLGVKIGNVFGMKYKSKAEFMGGCILIIMGIKILFEHLFNL